MLRFDCFGFGINGRTQNRGQMKRKCNGQYSVCTVQCLIGWCLRLGLLLALDVWTWWYGKLVFWMPDQVFIIHFISDL